MITIVRSDGVGLVLSSARTLTKVRQGLVVDFGEEFFIVEDCNLSTIEEMTAGQQASFIVIHKEWRGWPPTSATRSPVDGNDG